MKAHLETELRVLRELARSPDLTQKDLSRRLGHGLRLTNWVVRSLVRKGLVRLVKLRGRRVLYLITPQGMAEKSRLACSSVARFLRTYREVKETLRELLDPLARPQDPLSSETPLRVALYGRDEGAELIYLCLQELGVEVVGVFEPLPGTEASPQAQGRRFLGLAVEDPRELLKWDREGKYDRVVVADFRAPEAHVEALCRLGVPKEKILAPGSGLPGQTVGQAPKEESWKVPTLERARGA